MSLKTWVGGGLLLLSMALVGCQAIQPGEGPRPESGAATETQPTVPAPEATLPAPESGAATEAQPTVPAAEATLPAPEATVPAPEATLPAPEATLPAPEATEPAAESSAGIDEAQLPPAALNVRQALAQQLGIAPTEISVLEAEEVEWRDACLGAASPEVMCAAVITPGYRLVLEANGGRYVYHTDAQGDQFIAVEAPEAQVGDLLLEYTGTDEQGLCQVAHFGSEGVAWGGCYSDLRLQGHLVFDQREQDLAYFVSTFAPFEATTPAGDLRFHGEGTQEASEAEQRLVAEWARLAAIEAKSGRTSAGHGLAFAVLREGGIAAVCDNVSVYLNGLAYVADCRTQPPVTLPVVRLNAAQLEQLFGWHDTLATFEEQRVDGVADVMTTTVYFFGMGAQPAGEEERVAIEGLAAELAAQATEDASARVGSCPEAGEGLALYRNDDLGYCLLYPTSHAPVEYSESGTAFTVGGDLMNHSDARLDVEVAEASTTATEVADALVADFEREVQAAGMTRTVIGLGPVGAEVVDSVPGQELTRIVIAVHDGRLYTLRFVPAGPDNAGFLEMQALYDTVIDTFSFTE